MKNTAKLTICLSLLTALSAQARIAAPGTITQDPVKPTISIQPVKSIGPRIIKINRPIRQLFRPIKLTPIKKPVAIPQLKAVAVKKAIKLPTPVRAIRTLPTIKAPVRAVAVKQGIKAPVRMIKAPVRMIKAPVRMIKAPVRMVKAPVRMIKAPVRAVAVKQAIKTPVRLATPIRQVKAVAVKQTIKAIAKPLVRVAPVRAVAVKQLIKATPVRAIAAVKQEVEAVKEVQIRDIKELDSITVISLDQSENMDVLEDGVRCMTYKIDAKRLAIVRKSLTSKITAKKCLKPLRMKVRRAFPRAQRTAVKVLIPTAEKTIRTVALETSNVLVPSLSTKMRCLTFIKTADKVEAIEVKEIKLASEKAAYLKLEAGEELRIAQVD